MIETISNLGSKITIAGIIAAILLHYGVVLDPSTVGSTITDIAKVISDIAIIVGAVHQHVSVASANSKGLSKGIMTPRKSK